MLYHSLSAKAAAQSHGASRENIQGTFAALSDFVLLVARGNESPH
jgi:hypothetical protein